VPSLPAGPAQIAFVHDFRFHGIADEEIPSETGNVSHETVAALPPLVIDGDYTLNATAVFRGALIPQRKPILQY